MKVNQEQESRGPGVQCIRDRGYQAGTKQAPPLRKWKRLPPLDQQSIHIDQISTAALRTATIGHLKKQKPPVTNLTVMISTVWVSWIMGAMDSDINFVIRKEVGFLNHTTAAMKNKCSDVFLQSKWTMDIPTEYGLIYGLMD